MRVLFVSSALLCTLSISSTLYSIAVSFLPLTHAREVLGSDFCVSATLIFCGNLSRFGQKTSCQATLLCLPDAANVCNINCSCSQMSLHSASQQDCFYFIVAYMYTFCVTFILQYIMYLQPHRPRYYIVEIMLTSICSVVPLSTNSNSGRHQSALSSFISCQAVLWLQLSSTTSVWCRVTYRQWCDLYRPIDGRS